MAARWALDCEPLAGFDGSSCGIGRCSYEMGQPFEAAAIVNVVDVNHVVEEIGRGMRERVGLGNQRS
jgi:hypothetical protein